MKTYTVIIDKCGDSNLYAGYIPGFAGAHCTSQTVEELINTLKKIIEMLLEDDNPNLEIEFINTQRVFIKF